MSLQWMKINDADGYYFYDSDDGRIIGKIIPWKPLWELELMIPGYADQDCMYIDETSARKAAEFVYDEVTEIEDD